MAFSEIRLQFDYTFPFPMQRNMSRTGLSSSYLKKCEHKNCQKQRQSSFIDSSAVQLRHSSISSIWETKKAEDMTHEIYRTSKSNGDKKEREGEKACKDVI